MMILLYLLATTVFFVHSWTLPSPPHRAGGGRSRRTVWNKWTPSLGASAAAAIDNDKDSKKSNDNDSHHHQHHRLVIERLFGGRVDRRDAFVSRWRQGVHPIRYWKAEVVEADDDQVDVFKVEVYDGVHHHHHHHHDDDDDDNSNNFCGMRELYERNPYINLRRWGSREMLNKTTYPTFEDFEGYIQSGGSAIVSIDRDMMMTTTTIGTSWKDNNDDIDDNAMKGSTQLVDLKEGVRDLLGDDDCHDTSMNVYHSGPQGVALNRHYDSYDVLVLQLEGFKEWEVAFPSPQKDDNNCAAPLSSTQTDPTTTTTTTTRTTADMLDAAVLWQNITLQQGDVLYLPQGVWHAATTGTGCQASTHATIGLIRSL